MPPKSSTFKQRIDHFVVVDENAGEGAVGGSAVLLGAVNVDPLAQTRSKMFPATSAVWAYWTTSAPPWPNRSGRIPMWSNLFRITRTS